MEIKRFPGTQKFRVISGPVSIYTTANKIRNGLGDFVQFNAATQKALDALEFTCSGQGAADQCATGIAGTWEGLNVQIDKAIY